MKRSLFFTLLSIFFMVITSVGLAATKTTKPQGPLNVSIVPEGEIVSGQAVTFVVTVSSRMASPRLRVLVHPPADMELLDGELEWEGAIGRNSSISMKFTGLFSEMHVNSIAATAYVGMPGGGKATMRSMFRFGGSPSSQKAKAFGRVNKRGSIELMEIPLKR